MNENHNFKPTGRTHLCPGDHLHEDKLTSSEVLAWHHSEPRRVHFIHFLIYFMQVISVCLINGSIITNFNGLKLVRMLR